MNNLKKIAGIAIYLTLSILVVEVCHGQGKLPYLKKNGAATQLMVNDEPFLMIAGEVHNSSASTIEYMKPLFPKLRGMNLNSVFVTLAWEQFEPQEGNFDYTLVDAIIKQARQNDLKVCLLWFASWKNGQSSYAPLWVKKDTKRFFRVKTKDGKEIETLSPFCEATKEADATAFAQLMRHIAEVDKDHTVILMQPENEVGIFQDIDYHPSALNAYKGQAPNQLLSYLKKNKSKLKQEVKSIWKESGYKTSGTWEQVFGDTAQSREFFMVWQYASYMNYVAKKGREQYNLPMMVNAWIVQKPDDLPGVYPNGGPVSRVMDIWKAAAPDIDIQSPDIYLPNFKEICAMYHRDDNPLLIPESKAEVGRAFYAFGQHDAICFSPFGVEDASEDFLFRQAYGVLNEIQPLISKYQGTGKMKAVMKEGDEKYETISLGGYELEVSYQSSTEPCFGIIINTDKDEFTVAGMNLRISVQSTKKESVGYIGQVWEGRYENNKWIPTRLLNGDETWHNEVVRVFGRKHNTKDEINVPKKAGSSDPFVYSPGKNAQITTPGIYKVYTYKR